MTPEIILIMMTASLAISMLALIISIAFNFKMYKKVCEKHSIEGRLIEAALSPRKDGNYFRHSNINSPRTPPPSSPTTPIKTQALKNRHNTDEKKQENDNRSLFSPR